MTQNGQGEGIPVSRQFDGRLRRLNGLANPGFKEWVFRPAMLFGSSDKWWGAGGRRDSPHEGLDLCFYRTTDGNIQRLNAGIKIPALFGGEVVNVIEDYLGESVFVRHRPFENSGRLLYTVYGHIVPSPSVSPGKSLSEGDVIGVISGGRHSATAPPAHLHISAAWIPASFPADKLNWGAIGGPDAVLIDPLSITPLQYSVVERV